MSIQRSHKIKKVPKRARIKKLVAQVSTIKDMLEVFESYKTCETNMKSWRIGSLQHLC